MTITKQDLIKAMKGTEYDKPDLKSVILDMFDKHPDMVKTLVDAKDKEGKPLFDALEVGGILFNCKDIIEKHSDRITEVLNNPEEVEYICSFDTRGYGLRRAVNQPLSSTVEMNPQAFAIESKIKDLKEKCPKKPKPKPVKMLHTGMYKEITPGVFVEHKRSKTNS